MNTGFQKNAGFLALCDRLGTGMNTTLFRHIPPLSLGKFPRTRTARLFSGKMFGDLAEKSWQRSACFSHSDRTCGRERAWCEQLVSNFSNPNPRKAVTASSQEPAGISRGEKVNTCVPREMKLETAFALRVTASRCAAIRICVERNFVSSASQSATFSLRNTAIFKKIPFQLACG